jgi:hypothetical protein
MSSRNAGSQIERKRTMDAVEDYCQKCGKGLAPSQRPCPYCGATEIRIEPTLSETVNLEAGMQWKHKRKGYRRPIAEGRSGHEPSTNASKHPDGVDRTLTIDREKDEYSETVTDKKTHKLVRDVHEPLSQHRSRQKPKK